MKESVMQINGHVKKFFMLVLLSTIFSIAGEETQKKEPKLSGVIKQEQITPIEFDANFIAPPYLEPYDSPKDDPNIVVGFDRVVHRHVSELTEVIRPFPASIGDLAVDLYHGLTNLYYGLCNATNPRNYAALLILTFGLGSLYTGISTSDIPEKAQSSNRFIWAGSTATAASLTYLFSPLAERLPAERPHNLLKNTAARQEKA